MKRLLLVTILLLGCGKNEIRSTEEPQEKLERDVDANCGLIDACEGLEFLSEDKEFKCLRQKVQSFWGSWSGVDFGEHAGYTTYRLQQKDPACDLDAPTGVCPGPFGGTVPCCPYRDVEGHSLNDILPVKAGCNTPDHC